VFARAAGELKAQKNESPGKVEQTQYCSGEAHLHYSNLFTNTFIELAGAEWQ